MDNFSIVQEKLGKFIRKYYVNELIKGAILFFSIGLLYFLATLFVEHFLWLSPLGRTFLFWLFIAVELLLLIKFICIPLASLFKLRNGIDFKDASKIIGSHFSEVSDKLTNILQLSENNTKSELLLASIEQKSSEIKPVPFELAINFKKNLHYVKYATIPLAIILVIWISGNYDIFNNSYKRVVNYNTAFQPPAPFEFLILNENLNAVENKPFELYVKTVGDVIPEEVEIHLDGENYFFQSTGSNTFKYNFTRTDESIDFYLMANGVRSENYRVEIVKTPVIVNFEMSLDYPSYTKKKDEVLKSTGNAIVPEGTKIKWNVITKQTKRVEFLLKDTVLDFEQADENFEFNKQIFNDLQYEIGTSNDVLERYERLGFSLEVVKDKYPEIDVRSQIDTLSAASTLYFLGQISDDYGLRALDLIYYEEGSEEKNKQELNIEGASIFDQFTHAFPGDLDLKEGVNYKFYFEVTDNDAVNGGKKSKSQTYDYRRLTKAELEDQQLSKQNKTIENLDKGLDKLEEQQKTLERISKTQKEKSELNFNDKKKLQNFLERQKQQEQLMQNFTKELKQNLEEFQPENKDKDGYKELLQERLEREQKELERNEELLDELEKLTDKLDKEELARKIEELAKQQQNSKRNLEQIVELTKRYYVTAKADKVQKDLEKLAKDQEKLPNGDDNKNTQEEQNELNDKFEEIQKDIDELQKANDDLKKPFDLERNRTDEILTEQLQKEASEKLNENESKTGDENEAQKQQSKNQAKKKQKQAAQKLKKLSEGLKQQIQQGGQQGDSEDAEALRQILDNLVLFSFDQEAVLDKFSEIDNTSASFANQLRKQNNLRELFKHVDDSLFALSLRRPEISERVNGEIVDVYYNIDKALDRLAQNRIGQGVASQQFALTAANNLADFLSQVLDNMQQSMGQGQGQGNKSKGFQLPDIIQSQEQINQQFQKGLDKKGQKGQKEGEGQDNGQQSGQQDGKGNQKGQQGENGQSGNGDGENENDLEELYEIFKQQQQLRQALEQQLKDKIGRGENDGDAENLLKEIENVESELLEKGFNERTLQRLTQLKHQLLKLDNAAFEQGKQEERESRTNNKEYNRSSLQNQLYIKQYFNQVEILNRQVLPLRQIYKNKVQKYFKGND